MKKIKNFISSPKVSIAVFGAAIVLLLASSIGGASAALTYQSQVHETEIATQTIDVALIEKTEGNDAQVSPETLLTNLVGEGESVKTGKVYNESLSVQNTGQIDQYVRVTIYKYWVKEKKNDKGESEYKKDTTLNPAYIELSLKDGWVVDEKASTMERTVIYYDQPLAGSDNGKGQIVDFANGLRINPQVTKVVTLGTDGKASYDYKDAEFRIEVEVDAVQTHNAADAILSAWGCRVKGDSAGGSGELKNLKFEF